MKQFVFDCCIFLIVVILLISAIGAIVTGCVELAVFIAVCWLVLLTLKAFVLMYVYILTFAGIKIKDEDDDIRNLQNKLKKIFSELKQKDNETEEEQDSGTED